MAFKALVIRPDGTAKVEMLDDAGVKAVLNDGWLEGIGLSDSISAFIDEEGKQKNLPVNELALRIAHELGAELWPGDYIVGTMVIYSTLNERGITDGEAHDAPEWLMDLVIKGG